MNRSRPGLNLLPLDGSPHVSDNCWDSVTAALDAARARGRVRYLEWGAGNSTINIARYALNSGVPFNLISTEHSTPFFPALAAAVLNEVRSRTFPDVVWRPLVRSSLSAAKVRTLLMRRRFESEVLRWQVIAGVKHLQSTDGYRPDFSLSVPRIARQALKLSLIELGFWLWVAAARARALTGPATDLVALGGPERVDSDRMDILESPGQLSISTGDVTMELWHLPPIDTVWRRGVLFDGLFAQLFQYVDVPLTGTFDVVFVDGRARVPCIRRVKQDELLNRNGYLFVHDAYRAEMTSAFSEVSPDPTFISGSNIMKNGEVRCRPGYGLPRANAGPSLATVKPQISQELFVFQSDRVKETDAHKA